MRVLALVGLLWGLVGQLTAGGSNPVLPRPIPAVEHVVIISIDGLRPDLALLARTPTLHALAREGAYTFWARTTAVAITLPSHTSMVTGEPPERHGIDWNQTQAVVQYPRVPTIFDLAHQAGYATGMVAGKAKFASLNRPGSLSYFSYPSDTQWSNAEVCAAAESMIREHQPDLMLIHFPETDATGHAAGWGSPEYLAVLEQADGFLARILTALETAAVRSSTVVIVTADHGGAGLTHGGPDARSQHIPWIINGPGVRKGWDMTLQPERLIRIEDTAATALWLLGIALPAGCLGQPVEMAFGK